MLAPLIVPADPRDGAAATFPSALGVGERLCIRFDAPREDPAPGVAAGQGAAGSATAIQIIVHNLGRAVDVSTSAAHFVGHLGRRSSPRKGPAIAGSGNDSNSGREARDGRGEAFARSDDGEGSNSQRGRIGAISRSDGDTSNRSSRIGSISRSGGDRSRSDGDSSTGNNDLEGQQEIRDKKSMILRDELRGVFDILVLVMGSLVPIALLVYALLPDDNPSVQRIAWITLGIVVGLAVIAAVISRLGPTETAAEVSSSIGLLCTVVLIVVSEIVLVKCLPYDHRSFVWGTAICVILLIADIYAWAECAGRPKYLRSSIRGCPSCFLCCLMGLIGCCDKVLDLKIPDSNSGSSPYNID